MARRQLRVPSMQAFFDSSTVDPAAWPVGAAVAAFLVATLVIGCAGYRLASKADQLADRTGIGEALAGALLLGATTSAPGSVLSVVAAAGGHVELTMSHAIGGILVQTASLSVVDLLYRRANLEHAAASAPNIMQALVLIVLLGLIVLSAYTPDVTMWGVHPATPTILATYLFGMHLVKRAKSGPMWQPRVTSETRTDKPAPGAAALSLPRLSFQFALLAAAVGLAGLVLERASESFIIHAGIAESVVGGIVATWATSLPELVTSISAVRRGALTLAVGGIIGGNAFDTLFFVISDVAYRDGSIYHRATPAIMAMLAVALVMTASLAMGLVSRVKHGIANIGFESFAVLVLYAGAIVLLLTSS